MPDSGNTTAVSIALVGTRGVPARYGGFETCVEEVGSRLAARGHRVVVYCRRPAGADTAALPSSYLGMELIQLPAAHRRSLETLSHTALSCAHLVRHRTDVAIMFNSANAPLLPLIRAARIPVATHVDGLEWQRAKWGGVGQRYYRIAERLSVWWSNALIADAQGISDYYREKFDATTDLISYGAPEISVAWDRLAELGLSPRGYHLAVARFEPENNLHVIIEGYAASSAALPLVVVGSAPYNDEYTTRLHALGDDRVLFVGGIWDQELLDQLYANTATYFHGHSVGGTNPSLLRALGAGAATNAFDVVFNREVLGNAGWYFATSARARELFDASETDSDEIARHRDEARQRAALYDWDLVADQYEELCRLIARR